jgi:hypothetical protein
MGEQENMQRWPYMEYGEISQSGKSGHREVAY